MKKKKDQVFLSIFFFVGTEAWPQFLLWEEAKERFSRLSSIHSFIYFWVCCPPPFLLLLLLFLLLFLLLSFSSFWGAFHPRLDLDEAYYPGADIPNLLFNTAEGAASLLRRGHRSPPGACWQYSSGTTNLLCRVLASTFSNMSEYLAFPTRVRPQ
jgi:hypothetical protein